MLAISVNLIEPICETHQKNNSLSPIILISYLLLYKVADLIIIKNTIITSILVVD